MIMGIDFMKKFIFMFFTVFVLCLFFGAGCGQGSVDTSTLKKNDAEKVINKRSIRVKNLTIDGVLVKVLPDKLTNISRQCFIEQNGQIVYPPQPGGKLPKEAIELVQKRISFKLPANSTLGDLADILSEKLGKKGEFTGNAYLIKLK